MKKALGIILSFCLTLGILAACGGADSSASSSSQAASPSASSSQAASSSQQQADPNAFDAARAITVVSREDGSGTRGAFVELTGVLNADKEDMTVPSAVFVNSTGTIMTTVAGDPYAIGYISLGSLNNTVKALDVDGVAPSVETVKDGSYGIARPFNLATKGAPTEVAQDFLDYILSAEGQAVVVDNGFISIDDAAAAYAGGKPSGNVVVAGSSSVFPVMEKLVEAYKTVNPNAEIDIQMSDSSIGMQSAIDGICDIGMASRALKESELETLTPIVMAMDGIAMVVNPANPLTAIAMDTIKGIYLGELTTWDAL